MKKLFLIILISISFRTQTDVADGVLEKYKNRIFVTTGIRSCVNIARALNANFAEIYGLENDPH